MSLTMAEIINNKSVTQVDRHIAKRLAHRRGVLGWTLPELADRLDNTVTYQQLGKYEAGKNRIAASRLYEIGRVLNVPIDYFFRGL